MNFIQFHELMFAKTLEITCISTYAMFQTIFQSGESTAESEQHLPSIRKYDKINQLLHNLEIEENQDNDSAFSF